MKIPVRIRKLPPNGSHIFVKGKISGVPLTLLIDTGASQSVLDKHFVNTYFSKLPVTVTQHQTTGLGGNLSESSFVKMHRIRIGGCKIKPAKFALIDLGSVNDAYTGAGFEPVEAILGGDLLLKYHAVLDYGAKYLLLEP